MILIALSKIAKTCRVCPYVDTCDHKEMELHGYLPTPSIETLKNQTVEVKVNDVPLNTLTDMLKPIINTMAYINTK